MRLIHILIAFSMLIHVENKNHFCFFTQNTQKNFLLHSFQQYKEFHFEFKFINKMEFTFPWSSLWFIIFSRKRVTITHDFTWHNLNIFLYTKKNIFLSRSTSADCKSFFLFPQQTKFFLRLIFVLISSKIQHSHTIFYDIITL